MLRLATGGGDHPVAGPRQQRHRHRAHAARGAGHHDVAALRRCAVILQCHDAEHRGVAGGADRHRLLVGEGVRHRNEPIRLHPRLLGVAAPVALAQPVAVDQHAVAGRERVRSGFRDRPGQIDPADHRYGTANRRGAGDRQAVLVVQGGVLHIDQDVVLGQVAQCQVTEAGGVLIVDLVDNDRSKGVAHSRFLPRFQGSGRPEGGDPTARRRALGLRRGRRADAPPRFYHSAMTSTTSSSMLRITPIRLFVAAFLLLGARRGFCRRQRRRQ